MEDVSAFVLAGGQSTRMGTDKAFLVVNGRTLLARALEHAHSVTHLVGIVGPTAKFAGYGTVIEDVFPNCGPLGGIHAALSTTATELNLVLAVDLPFIKTEFLHYLLDCAGQSGAVITLPRAGGGLHPLCAVYRRQFRDRAEQALRSGRNKIDPLFRPSDTLVIEEPDLARLSFPVAMFDNLNTRADYERAQARDSGLPR